MHTKQSSGFTIIELLVVITIIVLLVSMLVPAIQTAMEHAQRAKCLANLHGISLGANGYAVENKGLYFIAGRRLVQTSIYPSTEGVDWPRAMAAAGLASSEKTEQQPSGVVQNTPSPIWDCPGNEYKTNWQSNQMVMAYQYFGGIRDWYNDYTWEVAASPVKFTTSRPNWALAADVTVRINQNWNDRTEAWLYWYPTNTQHGNIKGVPVGHNQTYVDGSAEWVEGDKLINISDWFGVEHSLFWYQADLNGWNPPASTSYAVQP